MRGGEDSSLPGLRGVELVERDDFHRSLVEGEFVLLLQRDDPAALFTQRAHSGTYFATP